MKTRITPPKCFMLFGVPKNRGARSWSCESRLMDDHVDIRLEGLWQIADDLLGGHEPALHVLVVPADQLAVILELGKK